MKNKNVESIEFISHVSSAVELAGGAAQIVPGLCNLSIDAFLETRDARLADYSYILLLIDKLSARSYALIEACIPEEKQQQAVKRSLRGIIDEQRDKAYRELVLGK
jgi:hypothetical protein